MAHRDTPPLDAMGDAQGNPSSYQVVHFYLLWTYFERQNNTKQKIIDFKRKIGEIQFI
jgi:hypothetical protein